MKLIDDSEYFWEEQELKGGHAITIVGWNEDGFIIRNSLGRELRK